jgi:UDP-N-acetylmuramoyl-L-alanyl-D-glutamate--2,6-diaminopimelate ligase
MELTGVCYDSRAAAPGVLFTAIRGFERDGHEYIGAAAANGAVCVLCEEPPETVLPYVLTENARAGLADASANWFANPAARLKIIGVTGTNGKTTVTSLLKEIIERTTKRPVGLIGTNRNMIGRTEFPAERTTPESYEIQKLFARMADAGCEYAVMEVSSHALALDRVHGVTFDVGVFMNLTPEHLDFHGTMEEYGAAKASLSAQSRAMAVNLDDAYAETFLRDAKCPVYTFSAENDAADLVAKRIRLSPSKVRFCALMTGKLQRVELNIPGTFSVYNALAAIGAAHLIGIGAEDASEALAVSGGVKGRAEVVPTGGDYTVIIDYAHTPDALSKIIAAVREGTRGRVMTLFGCGGDRDKSKRRAMGEIAARLSDFVVVTSDNPRTEAPEEIIGDILSGMRDTRTPYIVIENRREAIRWALLNALPEDTVLLAGKGHETYQIFGKEKRHFDEREAVREILAEEMKLQAQ